MKDKNEMSLAKFLTRYEFITGSDLKNITHEDVKILFPELKRSSFEYVDKHKNELYSGDLVLVNDGHKVIPYYVPKDKDLDGEYTEVIIEKEEEPQIEYKYYNYSDMSIYELKSLLKEKFSSCKNRALAKRELVQRGVIHKEKYNRCKEKNLMLRRKKDEEY